MLINRQNSFLLEKMISLLGQAGKFDDINELFDELKHRVMFREFKHFEEKAKEVIGLKDVMDEASKYI